MLPYKGKKGEYMLCKIKWEINKLLLDDRKVQFVYTRKKFDIQFNIKNKTKIQDQNEIIYSAKCPVDACAHIYNSKTGRKLSERANKHKYRKDVNSYMLKLFADYPSVTMENFEIWNAVYYYKKV